MATKKARKKQLSGEPEQKELPGDEEKQPLEKPTAEEDLTEIGGPPTHGQILLASIQLKNFTLSVVILLACAAIVLTLLYFIEKRRVDNLFKAVSTMGEALIALNKKSSHQSDGIVTSLLDPDTVIEAIRLSDYLGEMNNKNQNMMGEIDNMKALYDDGWKPYNGHLYKFVKKNRINHSKAQKDCEKRRAKIVVVYDDKEEAFIDNTVRVLGGDFWIGVVQVEDNWWQWVTGQNLTKNYWANGYPKSLRLPNKQCARVSSSACRMNLKCWTNWYCTGPAKWICKMEPDPNLLKVPGN